MTVSGASLASALVAGCFGDEGGEATTTDAGADTTETDTTETDAEATDEESPADAPSDAGTGTTEPGLAANETAETDGFRTPDAEPPPTVDRNEDNETE